MAPGRAAWPKLLLPPEGRAGLGTGVGTSSACSGSSPWGRGGSQGLSRGRAPSSLSNLPAPSRLLGHGLINQALAVVQSFFPPSVSPRLALSRLQPCLVPGLAREWGAPPLRPGEWAQLSCHQHRHQLSISSELLPGGWRGPRTTRRCSVSWEPSGEPPGWAQGCETFRGVGAAGRRCSLHQKPRAPGSQAGPALHSPTR